MEINFYDGFCFTHLSFCWKQACFNCFIVLEIDVKIIVNKLVATAIVGIKSGGSKKWMFFFEPFEFA